MYTCNSVERSSIRAERSRKKCSLSHLALYKFLKHPPEALVSSGSIISNKNNKYSKVLLKGVGGGCIVKRRRLRGRRPVNSMMRGGLAPCVIDRAEERPLFSLYRIPSLISLIACCCGGALWRISWLVARSVSVRWWRRDGVS